MKHVKLFFALFAMLALGVGNAWGETATLSISSGVTSNGTLTDGGGGSWSLTSDGSYTSNKAYIQVGTNSKAVSYLKLSTSSYSSKKIEKIQVWGTSKANTNVTIKVYIGGNKLGESSKFTSQTADAGGTEFAVENTNDYTGDILIEISRPSSAKGAIYFNKAVITYYEAGETPDVIVKTLKSIAVEGMTTNYETGDIFKFDGTCTATYGVTKNDVPQEDETKEVTPTSVSTPDMTTAGEKEVTVTYTEDEVTVTTTYTINVTENEITAGTYDIVPNNAFWGTSFTGTNANTTETLYGKQDDISILHTRSGSNLYVNDSQTRVYVDHYMQISVPAGYVITAIAFTADGDNWKGTHTADVGTMTDSKNWTGSANAVTITFGGTCRITKITVTYAEAGDTPEVPTLDAPTFDLEEGTYNEEQEVTLSAEEGTIYYTLDGTTPDAESIEYTDPIVLNECGEITIKAIAISGEITSSVASATYTIKLPLNNSQANPYTEADAIEVYDGGCYDNQDVYVMGVVKTAQFYSSNTYTITLEGGFQFYKFYEAAGEVTFTDDYIVAGDTLVACGKLVKYGETYELGAGCYLVEYKPYSLPKVDISNTKETAYTVEEAIALIDNITSDLTKQVYVKGTVSEIVTEYDAEYGNITYNISSDGSTSSPQFQLYRGKSYDGENFTSADDIKVGDKVVVYGEMKKHNSTYEMNAGNQLVALEREDTTTALDNVEATVTPVKAIVNGQLIIIKNGVQYNAQGQVIK